MRRIKLSSRNGIARYAKVDSEDYDWLNQWKWNAVKSKYTAYAVRYIPKSERVRQPVIQMHRLIVGAQEGFQVDHIDGDGLNNQRANLRIVTLQQNRWNRRSQPHSSRYKGVSWLKGKKRWTATIRIQGRNKFLGLFFEEKEAAKAYDNKAREAFGEYAKTNFN